MEELEESKFRAELFLSNTWKFSEEDTLKIMSYISVLSQRINDLKGERKKDFFSMSVIEEELASAEIEFEDESKDMPVDKFLCLS